MMSMKMWYLLLLAVFLPIVPTVAEVVKSVSDCAEFLLEAKPPHVPGVLEGGNIKDQNRYKLICQTFENQKRFLTLYDIKNRIPVFSAIKYTGEEKGTFKRPDSWMIEPQLETEDYNKNDKNMGSEFTYINQAVDNDYKMDPKLTRGHLIPSSYGFTKSDKTSTFTLTNIVPQENRFNGEYWGKMEQCNKCFMKEHCLNPNNVLEAYVVTGAIPNSLPYPMTKLNQRVNIPDILWTAFCCYSKKQKKWIARAHWGKNDQDTKSLPTKTLAELKQELKIDVFPETNCHDTVQSPPLPCPSTSTTSSCPT